MRIAMLRRWCLLLAIVLGCLILLFAYQGWLAWMLLLAVWGTHLFSLLVSLPAMLTARVKLDCAGTVELGTSVTLGLRESSVLPIPGVYSRIRVQRVTTGESWSLKPGEPLPTEHCGQLVCKLEKCYVYDYLKLFRLKVRHQEAGTLIVMPKPVQTGVNADLERFMAQSWKPKPGGGFAENHELRLYRPGDSMNQVHWKLTAKTGKLMIREAMEPVRRQLVLALELHGGAEALDIKMGKLLWLSGYLLERGLAFEIRALTGDGICTLSVGSRQELDAAMAQLLSQTEAPDGAVCAVEAGWYCHIGGMTDEA